jgi:hypothetical protein
MTDTRRPADVLADLFRVDGPRSPELTREAVLATRLRDARAKADRLVDGAESIALAVSSLERAADDTTRHAAIGDALRELVTHAAAREVAVEHLVELGRAYGMTWAQLGDAPGIDRRNAHAKYGRAPSWGTTRPTWSTTDPSGPIEGHPHRARRSVKSPASPRPFDSPSTPRAAGNDGEVAPSYGRTTCSYVLLVSRTRHLRQVRPPRARRCSVAAHPRRRRLSDCRASRPRGPASLLPARCSARGGR